LYRNYIAGTPIKKLFDFIFIKNVSTGISYIYVYKYFINFIDAENYSLVIFHFQNDFFFFEI